MCFRGQPSALYFLQKLTFIEIPYDVGYALIKWVYTDVISLQSEDKFLLNLLRVSTKYELTPLAERCEKALLSSVIVGNCISYYQTAEEIGAATLKNHCSELISNHWVGFRIKNIVLICNFFKNCPVNVAAIKCSDCSSFTRSSMFMLSCNISSLPHL